MKIKPDILQVIKIRKVFNFFLPDTLESRAIHVSQEGVGERQTGIQT